MPDARPPAARSRRRPRAWPALALGLALVAPAKAAAQDWHDAYRAGLAALSRGDHARAVDALERAIRLRPEPGRNVLTYGTNVEPRYFPYLRLAEAELALGRHDAARAALERSAAWGAREPPEERQALSTRLESAIAARRPPAPAAATPTPPAAAASAPPTPTPAPMAPTEPREAAAPAAGDSTPVSPPAPPAALLHAAPARPAREPAGPGARPAPRDPSPSPDAAADAPLCSIVVDSQPAGATVYVDDEPVGSTDPETGRLVKTGLALGRHRVRVAHAGHADAVRELDLAGGALTLVVALTPLAAQPAAEPRTSLLGFVVLAAALVGVLAWIGLRRPAHPTDAPAATPARVRTAPGSTATPRGFISPGARADEQGQEWFGDYRLHEMLGRGGMASVFRAERRGEIVALKRPLASFLDDQKFHERFLREAEIGRALNHPNIVRILERGEVDGVPYFTMELVAGETLLAWMQREGAAAPRFAARVVVQIAEALDYAHLKGVVHRDLKPSNIMLLADESARVMDFGIARAERFDTLTATSAFLGTPHYVAPEMIEGPGASAASDLYALGVVLFELITGQRPFDADTPFGILRKHCLEEPPPPGRLRPGLPPELDAVVLALLRKTPAERMPSAEALVIALRDFLTRAA